MGLLMWLSVIINGLISWKQPSGEARMLRLKSASGSWRGRCQPGSRCETEGTQKDSVDQAASTYNETYHPMDLDIDDAAKTFGEVMAKSTKRKGEAGITSMLGGIATAASEFLTGAGQSTEWLFELFAMFVSLLFAFWANSVRFVGSWLNVEVPKLVQYVASYRSLF